MDKRSETWSVMSGETREVEPGRKSSVEEVVWMAGVERMMKTWSLVEGHQERVEMAEEVETGGGSSGESENGRRGGNWWRVIRREWKWQKRWKLVEGHQWRGW